MMGVYRHVHTNFWQERDVLKWSPELKLFYLYLLTGPRTRQSGVYEFSFDYASMETGLSREQIQDLLKELAEHGKICFSEETEEILMVNWLRHNSTNSPKVKACIKGELQLVKTQEFRDFIEDWMDDGYPTYTLLIPYQYPILPGKYPMDTQTQKKEKKEKEKKRKCNITEENPFSNPGTATSDELAAPGEIEELNRRLGLEVKPRRVQPYEI